MNVEEKQNCDCFFSAGKVFRSIILLLCQQTVEFNSQRDGGVWKSASRVARPPQLRQYTDLYP